MNKIHCCVVLCHPSAAINKRRRLCYNLTPRPSETVRLPWKVHERGTVYRQLSAQPPHRLLQKVKGQGDYSAHKSSIISR